MLLNCWFGHRDVLVKGYVDRIEIACHAETILAQRQRIKRETLKTRRLQHHLQAA
jgi:hypothetical protein